MYPRYIIHSGILLWDPQFENTCFTVLNEFHVENITYFFKIPISLQNRSFLLLILLEGPRECIQDIISTVEYFCGILDLKTRVSLFRMSFMSKTLPNFSNFLYLCRIGRILLLILLGGPRKCIQDIKLTVEDFCGIPDLKTRVSLFRMSFMSKTLPNFLKFLYLCKIGSIMLLILLGDLESVSKT